MKMMTRGNDSSKAVILMVLMWSHIGLGQELCTAAELRSAERRHEQCVETVEARARATSSAQRQNTLCQRLEEQVHTCGEHLANCLSAANLRLVKDSQISSFITFLDAQNLSYLYRNCPVVQEFQNSNRKPFRATDRCSIDEVESVLQKRSECVSAETRAMQRRMRTTSPFSQSQQRNILCDFVDKALDECSDEIRRCYSTREFETFTQESYKVLSNLLQKADSTFRLTDCNGLATSAPLTDASFNVAPMHKSSTLAVVVLVASLVVHKWMCLVHS